MLTGYLTFDVFLLSVYSLLSIYFIPSLFIFTLLIYSFLLSINFFPISFSSSMLSSPVCFCVCPFAYLLLACFPLYVCFCPPLYINYFPCLFPPCMFTSLVFFFPPLNIYNFPCLYLFISALLSCAVRRKARRRWFRQLAHYMLMPGRENSKT